MTYKHLDLDATNMDKEDGFVNIYINFFFIFKTQILITKIYSCSFLQIGSDLTN